MKWEKGRLPTNQITLLDKIGFSWKVNCRIGFPWRSDRNEFDWQLWYNELVQFWKEHGHLEVKHTENLPLYDWMIRQRQNYKGTGVKLTDHQMEELEKIGFRR